MTDGDGGLERAGNVRGVLLYTVSEIYQCNFCNTFSSCSSWHLLLTSSLYCIQIVVSIISSLWRTGMGRTAFKYSVVPGGSIISFSLTFKICVTLLHQ